MDELISGLHDTCADVVSEQRYEVILVRLFQEYGQGEWASIAELCPATGAGPPGDLSPLVAMWADEPSGDPSYAVIIFYHSEEIWTTCALYNRQRLFETRVCE